MDLVLASRSPRRRVLLDRLVDAFVVDAEDVTEAAPRALSIPDALQVIARKKALAVSERRPRDWILAADTIVAHGNELLGKARTHDEARLRLATLSGDDHQVWTGLALARGGRPEDSAAAVTSLRMDRLPVEVLDAYIQSEAWQGKAGGYGIQDRLMAPYVHIRSGSWSNVVGLPLPETADLLSRNGIPCRAAPDETDLPSPFAS